MVDVVYFKRPEKKKKKKTLINKHRMLGKVKKMTVDWEL